MRLFVLLALCCAPMAAMENFSGYCEQGGQTVVVSSINSATSVQQSYPQCTITVYISGLSVASANYTSGGSITGSTSQTCTVTFIGGVLASGTVALTSSNTIAGGTAITIVSGGQGFATAPVTATLSSGSASCSGTAVVSSVLGLPVLATIYADNNLTPLTNPFLSATNGSYQFYAADGRYDLQYSGTGIASPFTAYDQQLSDWLWQPPGTANPSPGTVSRPWKDKISDIINVRDYGARDDGSTDNTNAIQAALNDAQSGQTVYFPCTPSALWTSTSTYVVTQQLLVPSNITLRGDDSRHCFIEQIATSSQISVLNLIGSDSVTITGLKVFSAGGSNMPGAVVIMGRYPSSSAAGHHSFYNCSFSGNSTGATVYSISSEENTYTNVVIEFNNGASNAGTAKYGYYTSVSDDLSLCSPACTTSSNLSIWFNAVRIANFGASASTTACIYDQMNAAAGHHTYKNGYCSPAGSGSHGYGWHMTADPVNGTSGFDYTIQDNRSENGDGFLYLDKGVQTDGILTGLHVINNTNSGSSTNLIVATNHSHIQQSEFRKNENGVNNNPVYFDYIDQTTIDEDYTANLTVNTIMTNSWLRYTGDASGFTLSVNSSSYQNTIITSKQVLALNGPLQLRKVESSLTNKAPVNVPCGAVPGTKVAGDAWCNNSNNRLYFYDGSVSQTYLESGVDTLNLLNAVVSTGLHFDANGRLGVSSGAAGFTLSACGTSPVVDGGNDNVLLFQAGTGTANSCTVTFANAWTSAFSPVCVASFQTGGIASAIQVATTTTTAVLTPFPSANMAGQAIQMICFGHN